MKSALSDVHDLSKVTTCLPWETMSERPCAHLISRLRDAQSLLYLHGFLTEREAADVRSRVDSWNDSCVRGASKSG